MTPELEAFVDALEAYLLAASLNRRHVALEAAVTEAGRRLQAAFNRAVWAVPLDDRNIQLTREDTP